jgi:hypothetical protein
MRIKSCALNVLTCSSEAGSFTLSMCTHPMTDKSDKNTTRSSVPAKLRATKSQTPNYALVSFVVFLCFVAVLLLLIANADKLSRFGLLQQVYYLVLVLMGLAAAGFLFGILHSSAEWVGELWGGKLRLTGSVVGAALVVLGGYYFAPKATSFPLTVYVRGEGGPQDIVLRNTGRVFLKMGQEISSESIGENGQAVFPRILADYRGQQVPGWVESDDYEASNTTVTIADSSVDLLVKKKIKRFKLAGTILDEHGKPLSGVHVALPEYHLEATTNSDGRFEVQVTADREQMVDLTAEKQGYQIIRLRPTLGDSEINFSLKRSR